MCGLETQRRCTGQTSHCNDVVFGTPCWYPPAPSGTTGITTSLCNSVAMVAATPMHGEARSSVDREQPVEGWSGVAGRLGTVLLCNSDGHQRCAGAAQTAHSMRSVHGDLLVAQMVSFELVVAGDDCDGHGGTVAVSGALRTTIWPGSGGSGRREPRHTGWVAALVARTIAPGTHSSVAQRHCSGSGHADSSLTLMDLSLERAADSAYQPDRSSRCQVSGR